VSSGQRRKKDIRRIVGRTDEKEGEGGPPKGKKRGEGGPPRVPWGGKTSVPCKNGGEKEPKTGRFMPGVERGEGRSPGEKKKGEKPVTFRAGKKRGGRKRCLSLKEKKKEGGTFVFQSLQEKKRGGGGGAGQQKKRGKKRQSQGYFWEKKRRKSQRVA